MEHRISINTVWRLPRYLRALDKLAADGVSSVSSGKLASLTGLTASTIRQDLAQYGSFGEQGHGYDVKVLRGALMHILGADRNYRVILVGAGHLGTAIIENFSFFAQGYEFLAAFETDPQKIGKEIGKKTVLAWQSVSSFIQENCVDIAVLTVPRAAAQKAVRVLAESGVKAIWNFTGTELDAPKGTLIESIHFADSLLVLTHCLTLLDTNENVERRGLPH